VHSPTQDSDGLTWRLSRTTPMCEDRARILAMVPLALEAPLVFQRLGFRLDLADGGDGHRDLVRRQGVQQHALERGIRAQRPDLLASGPLVTAWSALQ